jgi:hypothetical protein
MKTLKQRMETELSTSLYLCSDFNEIEAEFLRLTKEWLTQKRDYLQNTPLGKKDYATSNIEANAMNRLDGEINLIQDLLDELALNNRKETEVNKE